MATRLVPASQMEDRLPELVAAYRAMYRMEPDEGHRYGVELVGYGRREGFRLAAEFDGDTERILGFGLGFTGLPGQRWRDSLVAALAPEVADQWLNGHFEFAQFGVIPQARRRGVASRIYDVLFEGLPHERAILTVIESNLPARAFYETRGWITVHRGFFSPTGRGPYRVMGTTLRSRTAAMEA